MSRRRTKQYSLISNVEIFRRILDTWGEEVVKEGKIEIERQANIIAGTAKQLAPVKTGRLKDSIHVEYKHDGVVAQIVADAKDKKGKPYAKVVEFRPDAPRPFLMPAVDKHRESAYNAIVGAINRATQKVNNQNGH